MVSFASRGKSVAIGSVCVGFAHLFPMSVVNVSMVGIVVPGVVVGVVARISCCVLKLPELREVVGRVVVAEDAGRGECVLPGADVCCVVSVADA